MSKKKTKVDEAEESAETEHHDELPAEAPVFTESDLERRVTEIRTEEHERSLRVVAEFDNFRRRTAREKEQWLTDALQGFVSDMLVVFDSFDKAREVEGPDADGLAVTNRQLETVFAKYSIERIDPEGEPFDPQFHEAMTTLPTADAEPNTVIEVIRPGYLMQGRLVRPARVVVAGAVPDEAAASED